MIEDRFQNVFAECRLRPVEQAKLRPGRKPGHLQQYPEGMGRTSRPALSPLVINMIYHNVITATEV
jgi:hypothetical protein